MIFDLERILGALERTELVWLQLAGGAHLLHGWRVAADVDLAVGSFKDHLRRAGQVVVNVS